MFIKCMKSFITHILHYVAICNYMLYLLPFEISYIQWLVTKPGPDN